MLFFDLEFFVYSLNYQRCMQQYLRLLLANLQEGKNEISVAAFATNGE